MIDLNEIIKTINYEILEESKENLTLYIKLSNREELIIKTIIKAINGKQ